MKAISLWQPWASYIAEGLKLVETRHWPTKHRGLIAIHAARSIDWESHEFLSGELRKMRRTPLELAAMARGAVVAVAELHDCVPMTAELIATQSELELLMGNWHVGRFAWQLRNVVPLQVPRPALGKQGLFGWEPDDLLAASLKAKGMAL